MAYSVPGQESDALPVEIPQDDGRAGFSERRIGMQLLYIFKTLDGIKARSADHTKNRFLQHRLTFHR
jgi:hypothetical protein